MMQVAEECRLHRHDSDGEGRSVFLSTLQNPGLMTSNTTLDLSAPLLLLLLE